MGSTTYEPISRQEVDSVPYVWNTYEKTCNKQPATYYHSGLKVSCFQTGVHRCPSCDLKFCDQHMIFRSGMTDPWLVRMYLDRYEDYLFLELGIRESIDQLCVDCVADMNFMLDEQGVEAL